MTVDSVIEKIDVLLDDNSVPKNIKRSAEEARTLLLNKTESDMNVKKNEVFSILEEVADDSNVPIPAMTKLWAVLSELESL